MLVLEPYGGPVQRIHDLAHHEPVPWLVSRVCRPLLDVTISVVRVVEFFHSVLRRLLEQGVIACQNFVVRLVLTLKEFADRVSLAEMDDERPVRKILFHVANILRIDLVQKVPAFLLRHDDVGCHESLGQLVGHAQMGSGHGIAMHFGHEDGRDFEDFGREDGPMQSDVVHVPRRGHVRRPCWVEPGRVPHGYLVDRRVFAYDARQLVLDTEEPTLPESVYLRYGLAVLDLVTNFVRVALEVRRPHVNRIGCEVVDDGPL
mmetsp:Transcript_21423/g.61200  ORF Transcript_21423/g.61200 Transcript_21423/m.61200 type:complete len:260 (-) Transcript_21423:758-1537(-)